ncbi:MAG TPA: potassium transporter TrkG, partial [Phycisphaerae bacterium]|nr:potassium transporter TrkG [Phycisphaerae bacterium]
VSHARGRIGILDALFMSTSAVCVTGLATLDTSMDLTRFGHVVIIFLMQLGGLGIMTFAALGAQVVGRRLSFRSQAILSDSLYQSDAAGALRTDLKRVFLLTFLIEASGVLLLYSEFRQRTTEPEAMFSAVFHGISAFCNCGLGLYSDSLISYRARPIVLCTVMALIILGGLGHSVILEAARRTKRRLLGRPGGPMMMSLHGRVVLRTTACLIVAGTVGLLAFGQTPDERTWGECIWGALFQSVTSRTAGFNTVNLGNLPAASLLVLILLMFVGGSPASCAGGIKTTSLAVWIAHLRARLQGMEDTTLLGRRLPPDTITRVALVGGLSLVWNLAGCFVLAVTEAHGGSQMTFLNLLFEQISAFGTVGLSTGITPGLSGVGKLWIIMTMYIGRIGPLTAAMAVLLPQPAAVRYPQERVMIG